MTNFWKSASVHIKGILNRYKKYRRIGWKRDMSLYLALKNSDEQDKAAWNNAMREVLGEE